MRQPRRLRRELGLTGFLAFQLIVGGSALAALLHPLFVAGFIGAMLAETVHGDAARSAIHIGVIGGLVVLGYAASACVGFIGLKRRGLTDIAWVLLLTPLHWLLLSIAAWRALYQLAVAPYVWEKTEHGLAKNSRLAERMTRSLLELERLLRSLKQTGKLAGTGNGAPNDATRRRGRASTGA